MTGTRMCHHRTRPFMFRFKDQLPRNIRMGIHAKGQHRQLSQIQNLSQSKGYPKVLQEIINMGEKN